MGAKVEFGRVVQKTGVTKKKKKKKKNQCEN
jgi:hypothetical protein